MKIKKLNTYMYSKNIYSKVKGEKNKKEVEV